VVYSLYLQAERPAGKGQTRLSVNAPDIGGLPTPSHGCASNYVCFRLRVALLIAVRTVPAESPERVDRDLRGPSGGLMSARTECPDCHSSEVRSLDEILFHAEVDFFRCAACGAMWHVLKGEHGPASRSLLGNMQPEVAK
jgi:hypothetical protein